MAAKKKTILDEAKEAVGDAVEKVEEKVKEVVEDVEEAVTKKTKKTTKKSAKEKLLEKAKALEKGIEDVKDVDLKKKIKPEEEEVDTLVPMDDYLKASIHLGTRVITPDMRSYVYRRRADGLAVFNTALLDEKIREAAEFLSKFAPQDVTVVCKREAGWKAVKLFSEITGMKCFTKKYPAGILTNPKLDDFIETELIFICDPWLDKNALTDANRIRIPVLSVCDTNNYTKGVTQILPGNNKSARSLGIIFYLLAKLYVEKRKLDVKVPEVSQWIDNWDTLEAPK